LGANGREHHGERSCAACVERSSLRPLRLSDRDSGAVPTLPDVRYQGLETGRPHSPAGPASGANVTIRRRVRLGAEVLARRRRLVGGLLFAAITSLACLLLARLLTGSSWPLAHVRPQLVAAAGFCYFVSFVVRARGWRRLFRAKSAQARRTAWHRSGRRPPAASCSRSGSNI
jgi:hypothetical protein